MRSPLATFLKAIPAAVAGVLLITTATFAFNNLSTTGNSVSTVGGIATLQAVTNAGSVTTNSITAANFIGSGTTTSTLAGAVSSTRFLADDGLISATGFAFTASPNTGIYRAAGSMNFAVGGSAPMGLTATQINVAAPVVPTTDNARDLGTLALRFNDGFFGGVVSSTQFYAGIGTAAAPTYSFASNPNTGMYVDGSGTLSWATAGVLRLTLTSSALRSSQAVQPLGDNTIDIGSSITRWKTGLFVTASSTNLIVANDNATTSVKLSGNSIGAGVGKGTCIVMTDTADGSIDYFSDVAGVFTASAVSCL